MKLGIMLPTVHSVGLNAGALQASEATGADSIWFMDHLLGLVHPELWPEWPASAMLPDPDMHLDPFCLAAALGGSTELPMGVCVTDATRRRGADHARTSLTLNDACKGGFILGLGSGEAESLVPYGYPNKRPVGNMEEALIDIRALFDTGRMPGDSPGRTGLSPDGPQGIPEVWVAAQRPRMLALAGTYGDGWVPGPCRPDEYGDMFEAVKSAAERAERKAPQASLLEATIFGESRAKIAELLEEVPVIKLLALFSPDFVWRKYGLEHPAGPDTRGAVDVIPHALDPNMLRELAPRIPIELVEEFVMLGNAAEVAAGLDPYGAAGLDHVVLADLTAMAYTPEDAPAALGELFKLKPLLEPLGPNESPLQQLSTATSR
jgi:phthiodiolone/phenolphthiodiolone dimycocerosates ketoreductase